MRHKLNDFSKDTLIKDHFIENTPSSTDRTVAFIPAPIRSADGKMKCRYNQNNIRALKMDLKFIATFSKPADIIQDSIFQFRIKNTSGVW